VTNSTNKASYSPDLITCSLIKPELEIRTSTLKNPLNDDLSITVQKRKIMKQIITAAIALGSLTASSLKPNTLQLISMHQIANGGFVFDISGAPKEWVTM
jgi:hypothetical protein